MTPIPVGTAFTIPEVEVCFLDGAEARFHDPRTLGHALVHAYDNVRPEELQAEHLRRIGYQRVILHIKFDAVDEIAFLKYELGGFRHNPQVFEGPEITGDEVMLWYPSAWDELPKRRLSWPGDDGADLGRFFANISEEPELLMVYTRRSGHHPLHEHDHFLSLTLSAHPEAIACGTIGKLNSSNPGDTYRQLGEMDGLFTGRDDQVGNYEYHEHGFDR